MVFCPIYFVDSEDMWHQENAGLPWISHFIYIGFAFITLLIEVWLYSDVVRKIFHLVPDLRYRYIIISIIGIIIYNNKYNNLFFFLLYFIS